MIEINNTTKQKIDSKTIRLFAEKFLRAYKKSGYELSIAIVGDGRMAKLNGDYRGAYKPTDVLSFSGETGKRGEAAAKKSLYFGEVIINIQEAKRLKKYEGMLEEIGVAKPKTDYVFYFLLVHGLLHLAGYDDETEKGRKRMLGLGKEFLGKAGRF